MRVLLTGATGKLGSATHVQLLKAGFDVVATDMTRRPNAPGKVRVGDLLNREFCYELVDDVAAVVHLANHPNMFAGHAQRVFNENAAVNMNVFQAAVESGVKKIVFASSIQAANGDRSFETVAKGSPHPYLPIDGELPQRPGNCYALSKCVAEMQLQYFVQYHKLCSAVAIRFPMLMPRQFFADWKSRLNAPTSIHPHTPMEEGFTWLSTDDGGRLIAACLNAELPGYRCYLPAHHRPRINLGVREIIDQFFKGVPLRKPIEQIDAMVDISRITAETGWKPQDDFALAN